MDFQDITYAKADGIATITLNRPQALNALTYRMVEDCVGAIEDAKKDGDVKVLVITGAGRGFCAGMEISEVKPEEFDIVKDRHYLGETLHRMPKALESLDKPVLAAVNGVAVGAGMDIANMCDIRFASDKAKFGMTYVRMGLLPGDGGCYYLPRIVGIAKACELIWTGRVFEAQEALDMGYVNQVMPGEQLMATVMEFADRLAKGSSVAIQLAKGLVRQCQNLDLEAALEATEFAQLIARSTDDAREGPRAWVEKREPRFKGR